MLAPDGAGTTVVLGDLRSGAIFSADMQHRYLLWRLLDPTKAHAVLFVGLNPSKATHERTDHTVTKEVEYARRWGYGLMVKANLFGLRSTDPKALYRTPRPIGDDNDRVIDAAVASPEVSHVVACWGSHGRYLGRGRAVLDRLLAGPKEVSCFKLKTTTWLTKNGQPGHPLMLAYDTPLIRMSTRGFATAPTVATVEERT